MVIPYKIQQMINAVAASEVKWDKKFKCKFCSKEYMDLSNRRRHEVKEHINKDIKKDDLDQMDITI